MIIIQPNMMSIHSKNVLPLNHQVKGSQLERLFVPTTIAILALVCLLAVSVSSIWIVIGYVGSVSATGERA